MQPRWRAGTQLRNKPNGVLRRGSSAWTLMGTPLPSTCSPSGLTARLHTWTSPMKAMLHKGQPQQSRSRRPTHRLSWRRRSTWLQVPTTQWRHLRQPARSPSSHQRTSRQGVPATPATPRRRPRILTLRAPPRSPRTGSAHKASQKGMRGTLRIRQGTPSRPTPLERAQPSSVRSALGCSPRPPRTCPLVRTVLRRSCWMQSRHPQPTWPTGRAAPSNAGANPQPRDGGPVDSNSDVPMEGTAQVETPPMQTQRRRRRHICTRRRSRTRTRPATPKGRPHMWDLFKSLYFSEKEVPVPG